ncbi:hypothetical protein Tco_0663221 [Tanacetum coccineum]
MFEVSTILEDDSDELVFGGANGFVNVSLSNSATSSCGSTFVELIGEVPGYGASLSMEVEEDALAVYDGSRIVVEMGIDTELGSLKAVNLDNSTNNVLIPLDSWTSGLLVYKSPLSEEKARRRGQVFNWKTATYGKIRVDDDLYDLRSVEVEFPAIVIDDAFAPQDILPCKSQNEFPAIVHMSEYDEEEQNILYFNDLFPFNIILPNDLKSEKDNDDNDIDIIQSSEDMAPLPPREERHPFLRYQGLEYTDEDIADFKERLERIYSQDIHWVQIKDFQGMPELIRDGLFGDLWLGSSFWSSLAYLDLEREEMESLNFARHWSESERMILGKGDLHDYWRGISIDGDLLGPPPSYTLIRDPVLRLCHRMMAYSIAGRSQAPEKVTVTDLFNLRGLDVGSVNIPYLLVRYLRRFAAGRKSKAHIFGGQFVARLAKHFGLMTTEIFG